MDPDKVKRIAAVYGGDGTVKEASLAAGGLAASAQALARTISKHAVWGNGPRTTKARVGSTFGALTYATSQNNADNRDWALVFNTRQLTGNFSSFIGQLDAAVGAASL